MLFKRYAGRGQANVISLMILLAATLTVALALYAYFTGVYARQSEKQSLYDVYSKYANNINIYLEVYMTSNESNQYQYCAMVSVVNGLGDPMTLYLTILPVAPGTGGLSVDPFINETPVFQGDRELYAWIAADGDRDGVVELYNSINFSKHTEEFEYIPSCMELYYRYANHYLYGLSPQNYSASDILVSIEGPTLLDVAREEVPGLQDSIIVPTWRVTLPGFGRESLYFFLVSPHNPGQLSIVAAFDNPLNGKLVMFTVQPVNVK